MQDFLNDLRSPHFLLSCVVVGVFLNVLASYVFKWLEKLFPKVWSFLWGFLKRTNSKILQDVHLVVESLPLRTFAAARQATLQIGALTGYVISGFFFFASDKTTNPILRFVSIVIGVLYLVGASGQYGRAMKLSLVLGLAEDLEKDRAKRAKKEEELSAPEQKGALDPKG